MPEDWKDAEGHAVYDYKMRNKKDAYVILERNDGFILAYSPEEYFQEFDKWDEHQKLALKNITGGKVLDIGSGGGKHSLYLQKKGCDVTCIDVSSLLVKICKRQGVKAILRSVTQIDSELGVFDTILMLGNNFGLFGSPRRARWLLRKFGKITTEKARIIAESEDPYRSTDPYLRDSEYKEFNKKRDRMPGQFRLRVRYNKYKTGWFGYLYVSKEEMKQVLEAAGWKVSRFVPGRHGKYIAIIEKQ